jgi:hypothetical protein
MASRQADLYEVALRSSGFIELPIAIGLVAGLALRRRRHPSMPSAAPPLNRSRYGGCAAHSVNCCFRDKHWGPRSCPSGPADLVFGIGFYLHTPNGGIVELPNEPMTGLSKVNAIYDPKNNGLVEQLIVTPVIAGHTEALAILLTRQIREQRGRFLVRPGRAGPYVPFGPARLPVAAHLMVKRLALLPSMALPPFIAMPRASLPARPRLPRMGQRPSTILTGKSQAPARPSTTLRQDAMLLGKSLKQSPGRATAR